MKLRQTSITQPRLPNIYARTRLLCSPDQDRRYPVTWITGPPGLGKTTLAASYPDSRRLACLLYKLDGSDGDIDTFFSYLRLAAKKTAPRKHTSASLLTPEYLLNASPFVLSHFFCFFRGTLWKERAYERPNV